MTSGHNQDRLVPRPCQPCHGRARCAGRFRFDSPARGSRCRVWIGRIGGVGGIVVEARGIRSERLRVRSHVLRAVCGAQAVALDFDGVVFDVQAALGPDARENAISELLLGRERRPLPLPIICAAYGVNRTLALLSEREPDYAVEVETQVSRLELDAALTACDGWPAGPVGRMLGRWTAGRSVQRPVRAYRGGGRATAARHRRGRRPAHPATSRRIAQC
jgi:hypothetical protein